MKERHIICNATEVRSILGGSKSMFRRVITNLPELNEVEDIGGWYFTYRDKNKGFQRIVLSQVLDRCPHGQIGDRLWVKETWSPGYDHNPDAENGSEVSIIYKADKSERRVKAPSYEFAERWQSSYSCDGPNDPILKRSIFMPRWASRILLEVVNVKVERLQDISEEDARKEGIYNCESEANPLYTWCEKDGLYSVTAKKAFHYLWDSINGKDLQKCWGANPWVWAIEFRRVE